MSMIEYVLAHYETLRAFIFQARDQGLGLVIWLS